MECMRILTSVLWKFRIFLQVFQTHTITSTSRPCGTCSRGALSLPRQTKQHGPTFKHGGGSDVACFVFRKSIEANSYNSLNDYNSCTVLSKSTQRFVFSNPYHHEIRSYSFLCRAEMVPYLEQLFQSYIWMLISHHLITCAVWVDCAR
jgi:hypothetical protein